MPSLPIGLLFAGGRGTSKRPTERGESLRPFEPIPLERGFATSCCVCILRLAPECRVASGGRGTLLLRENPPRSPNPRCGRLSASFTVPRELRSAPERMVASGGLGTLRPGAIEPKPPRDGPWASCCSGPLPPSMRPASGRLPPNEPGRPPSGPRFVDITGRENERCGGSAAERPAFMPKRLSRVG